MVTLTDQREFKLSQIDRTNISHQLPFTTEAAEHLLSQHLQREEVDTKASFTRDRIVFNPVGFRDALRYRDIAQFLKCDTIPGLFMLYIIDEKTNQHYFESYKCARPKDLPDMHALLSVTMTDKNRELKDAPRVANGTEEPSARMKQQPFVLEMKDDEEDSRPLRNNLSVINASPQLRKHAPETTKTSHEEPNQMKQSFVAYPIVQKPMAAVHPDRSVVHTTHRSMAFLSPSVLNTPQPKRTVVVEGRRNSLVLLSPEASSDNVVLRKPPVGRSLRLSQNSRWVRPQTTEQNSATVKLVPVVNRTQSQEAPAIMENPMRRFHTYTPTYPSPGPVDDLVLFRRKRIQPSLLDPSPIYRTRSYEQPLNYAHQRQGSTLHRPISGTIPVKTVYMVERGPNRLSSDHSTPQKVAIQQRVPTQVVRPLAQPVPRVYNSPYQHHVHSNPPIYRTTKTFFTGASAPLHRKTYPERIIILNSQEKEAVTRRSHESLLQAIPQSDSDHVYIYSARTRHEPNP